MDNEQINKIVEKIIALQSGQLNSEDGFSFCSICNKRNILPYEIEQILKDE